MHATEPTYSLTCLNQGSRGGSNPDFQALSKKERTESQRKRERNVMRVNMIMITIMMTTFRRVRACVAVLVLVGRDDEAQVA